MKVPFKLRILVPKLEMFRLSTFSFRGDVSVENTGTTMRQSTRVHVNRRSEAEMTSTTVNLRVWNGLAAKCYTQSTTLFCDPIVSGIGRRPECQTRLYLDVRHLTGLSENVKILDLCQTQASLSHLTTLFRPSDRALANFRLWCAGGNGIQHPKARGPSLPAVPAAAGRLDGESRDTTPGIEHPFFVFEHNFPLE